MAYRGGRKPGARNKRTIAREAAIRDYEGIDPREYLASVLADPEQYDEIKFMAAKELMPYTYARLSSSKVDADVNANVSVVELDKSGGRVES